MVVSPVTGEAEVMNPGFGERLRELRRTAGISQVELAGEQLSPSYISLLEAGKRQPSAEAVQIIAERLGCMVGDLVDPVTREQAQRAQLEIAYARLAMANGEITDARGRLEELLPQILTDRGLTDEVRMLLSEAYWRGADYRAAIETTLPLYERCVARASHLPLATVGLRLTRFYIDAGDLQAAIRHGESALRVMSEQGLEDTDEFLRAAATLLDAYYQIGDLVHAAAWASGLIERAERRGSTAGQAALYWNAALVEEAQGRLTEAVQLSERAVALLSEQHPSRDLGLLYTTCAYFLLEIDSSRAGQAVGLLDLALPVLKDFAASADLGFWEGTRALAALALGEPVAAEDYARQAVVTLAAEDRPEHAQAHLSLGDALTLQGRDQEAMAAYLAADQALQRCPQTRAAAAMWRELADRLVRAGKADEALTAYRRALDVAGVRAPALPGGSRDRAGAPARSPGTPATMSTTDTADGGPAPAAQRLGARS
ncbi:MAG TPA: helix-turn-helix domain-containing protein [Kineosporiaceae bacterium]|nr:helix-turn-helix domain-containing protein [Kineosporiaceae bacterium]